MDFVGEALASLIAELAWEWSGLTKKASSEEVLNAIPHWFLPVISIDDLPDAYRSIPIHSENTRAALVAVWSEKSQQWLFCESRSMLFGLAAAVSKRCRCEFRLEFKRIAQVRVQPRRSDWARFKPHAKPARLCS